MQWSFEVVTPAAAEPVTVGDAESQLRVAVPSDDPARAAFEAEVGRLIKAAREYAEAHTARKFMPQDVRLTLDRFPCDNGPIRLMGGAVRGLTSVKYRDTAGSLTTLVDCRAWLSHEPALVYPPRNAAWPATDPGGWRAVEVDYAAGAANVGAVPAAVKQAILLIVTHNHENRGDDPRPSQVEIPPGARRLLDSVGTGFYL